MKVCTEACILGALAAFSSPRRILDIGAGTGLLGLMLAQRYSCPVDAVEINESACDEANLNFSNSPWSDRITLFRTRVQDFSSAFPYDLIVSNPPFYQRHPVPVDGGRTLALHNQALPLADLVRAAMKFLTPEGLIYVLLPPSQLRDFSRMMKAAGFYRRLAFNIYNSPGKALFRVINAYSMKDDAFLEKDFTIKDAEGRYTEQFTSALRPYYLDL